MFHLLLAIIYMAFISLGLPDSLLGSAWPSMYVQLEVPVSYAGIIAMIIAAGTVVSSLQSDRLTKKLGTGKVTMISVAMTAVALLGFSFSPSFVWLCIWAIPYGLGAGSVDASLNNYVALHYESRHMSWLHCMWGIGASVGPYIMSYGLMRGHSWNRGYFLIAMLQMILTVILLFSLPLWKKPVLPKSMDGKATTKEKPLTLRQIVAIPGAKEIMLCFFCYCALEQTVGLWASSYMVLHKGIDAKLAAEYASLFYIGITAGRAISGFLTMIFSDTVMIRLGQGLVFVGLLFLCYPGGNALTLVGLSFIGLGCAPIYPCVIHSTPTIFGADKSQAIIGVQMASAYIGTCLMPSFFGFIANHISITLFPVYLLLLLLGMLLMHILLVLKTRKHKI